MSDDPSPKWLENLLKKQTAELIGALGKQNDPSASTRSGKSTLSKNSSKKRKHEIEDEDNEDIEEDTEEEEDIEEEPEESDEEFDRKYGHLIGTSSEGSSKKVKAQQGPPTSDPNDTEESEDEDLLDILDKIPNWDTSSSIKKFISNNIDRPLSEEVLKQINEDFTPQEGVSEFFKPPEMPSKLLKPMKKLFHKSTITTERALFNAQNQLFVISKPIVSALTELKPLGDSVKKARELLSISLRGIYSVSLKMSHARRENARFLIKNPALAETLYSYLPTHSQLFRGTSFSSQLDKAVKESKIDLSWNKAQQKKNYSHFQNGQGFHQYSKGAWKFFNIRTNYNNNNYNKFNGNNRRKANNYPQKGTNKGKSSATSQTQ